MASQIMVRLDGVCDQAPFELEDDEADCTVEGEGDDVGFRGETALEGEGVAGAGRSVG